MREFKTWLAIDALTICYTPKSLEALRQLFTISSCKDYGDFYVLRIYDKTCKRDFVYEIRYHNGLKDCALGKLSFNRKQNERTGEYLFWVKLANEALYNGDFWCISYVSQQLGLNFHNFSRIEIAIDTERNPLRLYENLKMLGKGEKPKAKTLYNGKTVDWNAKNEIRKKQISGLRYIHLADSHALCEKTLYVEPQKGKPFLKIYNKTNEIKMQSGKEYILAKYGDPNQIWRIEQTVYSEGISEYIKKHEDIKLNPMAIFQRRHLLGIFKMFSNRLLRWNVGGVKLGFADFYKPQKTSYEAI